MSTATQPIGVIARLLDLSERRIQQLSREGVIPKAERGHYDLIGSVRGYVRYLRDQALKAQAGAPDYAAERARFIRARADLAEMEAEEKRHLNRPGFTGGQNSRRIARYGTDIKEEDREAVFT